MMDIIVHYLMVEMLKPYDTAKQILAQAQDNICDSNNLRNILTASNVNSKDKS